MFEFKKGDPENLEGRVLAYLENVMSQENNLPRYLAIRMVTDPSDLEDGGDSCKKMLNNLLDKVKLLRKNAELGVSAVFYHQTAFNNLEEISEIIGDVISGGRIYNVSLAEPLLESIIRVYHFNYLNQLEKRMDLQGAGKASIGVVYDSYDNYKEDSYGFKKKFYSMVAQLWDAYEHKEIGAEKMISTEIKEFTRGSPLLTNVAVNIIGLVRTNMPNKLEVITLYSKLATLVQEERYTEARDIKRRIDDLISLYKKQSL